MLDWPGTGWSWPREWYICFLLSFPCELCIIYAPAAGCSIFKDPEYKKHLALNLARNYPQLAKNFVADSHHHDVCVSPCVWGMVQILQVWLSLTQCVATSLYLLECLLQKDRQAVCFELLCLLCNNFISYISFTFVWQFIFHHCISFVRAFLLFLFDWCRLSTWLYNCSQCHHWYAHPVVWWIVSHSLWCSIVSSTAHWMQHSQNLHWHNQEHIGSLQSPRYLFALKRCSVVVFTQLNWGCVLNCRWRLLQS